MSKKEESQAFLASTRVQRWFLLCFGRGHHHRLLPGCRAFHHLGPHGGHLRRHDAPLSPVAGEEDQGKEMTSAVLTVLAIFILLIGPAIFFVGMLANEALNVSESVGPWIQAQAEAPGAIELRFGEWARNLPLVGELLPEREVILGKLGEIAGLIGGFLVTGLASATRGTVNFILQLCIMLYANYFFLRSGRETLAKIMHMVPLESEQEDRLVSRFVSVTRATLKGSLVIGIIQGTLAGLAFAVVGIEGPYSGAPSWRCSPSSPPWVPPSFGFLR